jgi:hypothetical protein
VDGKFWVAPVPVASPNDQSITAPNSASNATLSPGRIWSGPTMAFAPVITADEEATDRRSFFGIVV